MARSKTHVHKYLHSGPMWKCAEPSCTSFMYDRQADLALPGKLTICWGCGEAVVMTLDMMKQDMPTCDSCASRYSDIDIDSNTQVIPSTSQTTIDDFLAGGLK